MQCVGGCSLTRVMSYRHLFRYSTVHIQLMSFFQFPSYWKNIYKYIYSEFSLDATNSGKTLSEH